MSFDVAKLVIFCQTTKYTGLFFLPECNHVKERQANYASGPMLVSKGGGVPSMGTSPLGISI